MKRIVIILPMLIDHATAPVSHEHVDLVHSEAAGDARWASDSGNEAGLLGPEMQYANL